MSVWDSIVIAVRALRVNLLRSVLTTLGIVIGVASVIILVAVGTGASSEVDKQIKALVQESTATTKKTAAKLSERYKMKFGTID